MTLLYSDPLFLRHDTGRHVETADRLRSVTQRLEESGLLSRCRPGTVREATPEMLAPLHSPEMIRAAKAAAATGGGRLDADTVVCPDSEAVALAAAGTCAEAVDAVIRGDAPNALCLVRPPGHHATPTRSMGFCLYNSVAVAAHHARRTHGLSRILIVDWDVHHGNGTQDIFYEDPGVMFLSIHRHGFGFYPGTGDEDETGAGEGLGTTRNVAVRYGTSPSEYHDRFTRALEEAASRIRPELVLISAGFDAHHQDPIGSLGLDLEDFERLTRQVMEVARVHAGGRVVSCLEGGYDLDALSRSVEVHLKELLHDAESRA